MEGHSRHCRLVQEDPSLSSAHGVKRASILNQSIYFNVVDSLDLDVMHDQLEGVLALETKMLLQQYIKGDYTFTLDTVNEIIVFF